MTTILGASARHFRQMQQECESLIKERDALREQVRVLSEAAEKPSTYVPPKPNHQVQSLIEAARCLGVAQAKGDHTQHWESVVADLSVALNAAVKPAGQKGGE